MPIVKTPTAPVVEKPNLVISDKPYVSQVVDTRKERYDTLSNFIAGSKWAVDYYSQLHRGDSANASYQSDLPLAYGQYRKIRNFEFVVTEPLTNQQSDDDSRGWITTGASLVYGVLTPNEGDLFVADIGDGRNALFHISSVKRNSIYSESTCSIEYRVVDFLSKTISDALESKVIDTYYFDREYFRNGVKALISESEIDIIKRLNIGYRKLVALYMRDFFSRKYYTLLVPDQIGITYDPFMTDFVNAILENSHHPDLINMVQLGVNHKSFSRQATVLDVILKKDYSLIYSVSNKCGLAPVGNFRANPRLHSIAYSGVEYVVSIKDAVWNAETSGKLPPEVFDFSQGQLRSDKLSDILPDTDLTDNDQYIPLVHPVTKDDYYIFSKSFYEDSDGQSVLENLLVSRLKGEVIDLNKLAMLADAASGFDNLQRYYYIPIILTLIKLAPGVL